MQEDPNFNIQEMKNENFSINYKMVIVARKDLKMQTGKIAAQVGHGVLAAYKACLEQYPKVVQSWEMFGQAKVVLQANSQQELLDLQQKAHELGVIAETIEDAGRTQVAPGSMTVCAIGPAEDSKLK